MTAELARADWTAEFGPIADLVPLDIKLMKISKVQLVLNILLALFVMVSIASITRISHQIPANMLLGFLPSGTWALWVRSPSNRNIGGIAVLCNGLLAVGGVLTLIAALMGAMNRESSIEQLGFYIFGFFLLMTGFFNTRAIWRSFPAKVKAESHKFSTAVGQKRKFHQGKNI